MLKDLHAGEAFLDSLFALNEDALSLYQKLSETQEDWKELFLNMEERLQELEGKAHALNREEPALMTVNMHRNIAGSLQRIGKLAGGSPERASHKIRYELIPFILDCYTDLYFFGFCYPDRKKMNQYYADEMKQLCPPNIPADEEWPVEVSVVVSAYNKIEYTRKCLDSILACFPKDLDHELVLVNTGSTDGTKELFESYHPDKQIDMECMVNGFSVAARVVEGKYILFISNDVIVMPGAVENLFACLMSEKEIACVAPTCPNIANLQTIPGDYRTRAEMEDFARRNNVSDPYRWHQRSRLNPPMLLARSDSPAMYTFWGYWYPNAPERFLAFTDDTMAMAVRQSGEKLMLATDAFVYHAGSATVKDMIQERDFYARLRGEFQKTFDLDPWGMDFCYDPSVLDALDPSENGTVKILSVNCGLGDTPLAVKNALREKHNRDCTIYGISTSSRLRRELPGLCDYVIEETSLDKALAKLSGKRFSYIIIGNYPQFPLPRKYLPMLEALLADQGKMLIFTQSRLEEKSLKQVYTGEESLYSRGRWQIYERLGAGGG